MGTKRHSPPPWVLGPPRNSRLILGLDEVPDHDGRPSDIRNDLPDRDVWSKRDDERAVVDLQETPRVFQNLDAEPVEDLFVRPGVHWILGKALDLRLICAPPPLDDVPRGEGQGMLVHGALSVARGRHGGAGKRNDLVNSRQKHIFQQRSEAPALFAPLPHLDCVIEGALDNVQGVTAPRVYRLSGGVAPYLQGVNEAGWAVGQVRREPARVIGTGQLLESAITKVRVPPLAWC